MHGGEGSFERQSRSIQNGNPSPARKRRAYRPVQWYFERCAGECGPDPNSAAPAAESGRERYSRRGCSPERGRHLVGVDRHRRQLANAEHHLEGRLGAGRRCDSEQQDEDGRNTPRRARSRSVPQASLQQQRRSIDGRVERASGSECRWSASHASTDFHGGLGTSGRTTPGRLWHSHARTDPVAG